MTPLTAVPKLNLHGGKLLGAVKVSPANAHFYRDTYLVIKPTTPPGVQEQEAVKFTGEGEDEHFIPLAPQTAPIVLPIAGGGEYALIGGSKFKPSDTPGWPDSPSAITHLRKRGLPGTSRRTHPGTRRG